MIYNDVENISKSAVAFNNSYSSSSKSSGVSTGVTINYNHGFQAEANAISISASKSNMNTNGTNFQNGRFVNVNEVHNNTKNMMLSGFHQEGGSVTGNIENLTMESKQNTSTTTGSTKGGSLGISPTGIPLGSVKDSKTKGERKVVDTPTTFLIGDGSNLKVGKVENTAGAIGATGSGKLSIDEYVGHNLENVEKSKTKGGSIGIFTTGISSIGLEYSDRKQEGVTKNTVIGNVEIGKSSGDEIHKDLASMTEITKDRKFETNIHVEAQTINYVKNPEKWKEDITKAKNEIHDIYHTVDSTVNPKGKESRNVFEQLGEIRQARTIHNVISSRLEVAEKKEDIAKAFEGVSKDLGYSVKVIYTDPRNSPQLIGTDKDGNRYVKDGTAYVDERTGIHHILINSKSEGNKTKAGLIGTIAEEQSHIIGKIEGRQKKVPDGSEKGLENLGRPTNAFFQEQYRKNNQAIEVVSDGKDYSNVDFGEHVGDYISPEDIKERRRYREEKLSKDPNYKVVKSLTSTGMNMTPGIGEVKLGIEVLVGKDLLTGEKYSLLDKISTTTLISKGMLERGLFQYGKQTQPNLERRVDSHLKFVEYTPNGAGNGKQLLLEYKPKNTLPVVYKARNTLPVVYKAENTALVLYKNPNLFPAPAATNRALATTSLLLTDRANKVSQVQNSVLPNKPVSTLPVVFDETLVNVNKITRKTDFYVGPSGANSTLPATAYRYIDSKWYDMTKKEMSGPLRYFGFEKLDNAYQVRDRYQIAYDYYNLDNVDKTWSDASVRGTFDTLQLYNNKGIPRVKIPKIYGNTGKELEPFTTSYPQHGQGGAHQLIPTEDIIVRYDKLELLPNPRTDLIRRKDK